MTAPRSDIAQRVRDLVPAHAAAECYGFTPNRSWYICCPFHNEHTASLKFFPDGGWHCFGCGRGGSSIDFVMELFDLDFRQAVVRLDTDFFLHLTGNNAAPSDRSAVLENRRKTLKRKAKLEQEEKNLNKEFYRLHKNRQFYAPHGLEIETDFHPLFVEALLKLPEIQYRLDEIEFELRRIECGENRNSRVSV